MKRLLALAILFFILISILFPVFNKNMVVKQETQTQEETTSEIETETIEEIIEETTTEKIITIYDVFSYEEIYLIQRCVETECYTADIQSKINVACVIFNRYKDGRFGNNIKEIITSPKQFSYYRKEISETTTKAIEQAWINDYTQGALFFHSSNYKGTFNDFATYIFTDDIGHHFYKQ